MCTALYLVYDITNIYKNLLRYPIFHALRSSFKFHVSYVTCVLHIHMLASTIMLCMCVWRICTQIFARSKTKEQRKRKRKQQKLRKRLQQMLRSLCECAGHSAEE